MSELILPTSADWANVNLHDGLCMVDGELAELVNPELWEKCIGAWSPAIDPHPWDYSGSNNHGQRQGGLLDEVDAWKLDGVNDYILAPSLALTTAMAAFAWVMPRGTAATNEGIVAKYIGYGGNYRSWVISRQADNKVRSDFSASGTYEAANAVVSAAALGTDVWSHVGFTYQASVGSAIWIDGRRDGFNATAPASLFQSAVATWIGCQYAIGEGQMLNGLLGPVAVFRDALVESKIQLLAADRHAMYRLRRLPAVFDLISSPPANRRRRLLLGAA